MILITGGSGNVGTELVKILMARGIPFRAMVRSPEAVQKMAPRAGVEVVAARTVGDCRRGSVARAVCEAASWL